MLTAHDVIPCGQWTGPAADHIMLDHDARHRRRWYYTADHGTGFLLDLARATVLNHGDAVQLSDGRLVEILAAPEALVEVTAADPAAMIRLAWHIGNRHTPCQVAEGHLVIRRDPVIEAMLKGLGATLTLHIAPFRPEGGAYGHGRTMGHDHGPAGHFALTFGGAYG